MICKEAKSSISFSLGYRPFLCSLLSFPRVSPLYSSPTALPTFVFLILILYVIFSLQASLIYSICPMLLVLSQSVFFFIFTISLLLRVPQTPYLFFLNRLLQRHRISLHRPPCQPRLSPLATTPRPRFIRHSPEVIDILDPPCIILV